VTSNLDREFTGVAHYDLDSARWDWLIDADDADVTGWPAPDGSLLLVERNDDGASRLTLHDLPSGQRLRDVLLADAVTSIVTWNTPPT
jgi:hypothetical protein